MRVLDLALKDLRQIIRDRRSLLFLLVMPVIFTFFFGYVFGNEKETDNRLQIGILNQDAEGIMPSTLETMLASSETVRPVMLNEARADEVDEKVLSGDLAAAVVIPRGFSAGVFAGEPPRLEVIIDEQTQNGQTARRALQTNLLRLLGSAQAARLNMQAYEAQAGFESDTARQAYLEDALTRSAAAWQEPPLSVTISGPAAPEGQYGGNPNNQFSPGMMVQFAIFGLVQAAMVLVIERRCGAMQRLLTTPMRRAELIAGHMLGIFTVVFVQQVILVAFGQFFLKVDYLREPLAILLMMASLSVWVASLGLLIATLARKEEQVILMSMAAMFIFSALGGAWFSLEYSGETFSKIGHLMPSAWAIDGFQNIVLRGMGLESVLLPGAILLAYSLVFFGAAVWRFRFE